MLSEAQPQFVLRPDPFTGNRLERSSPDRTENLMDFLARLELRNGRRRPAVLRAHFQTDLSDDRQRTDGTRVQLGKVITGDVLDNAAARFRNLSTCLDDLHADNP